MYSYFTEFLDETEQNEMFVQLGVANLRVVTDEPEAQALFSADDRDDLYRVTFGNWGMAVQFGEDQAASAFGAALAVCDFNTVQTSEGDWLVATYHA